MLGFIAEKSAEQCDKGAGATSAAAQIMQNPLPRVNAKACVAFLAEYFEFTSETAAIA
jgi:hypothetical protein